jgi:hypothetical protein
VERITCIAVIPIGITRLTHADLLLTPSDVKAKGFVLEDDVIPPLTVPLAPLVNPGKGLLAVTAGVDRYC